MIIMQCLEQCENFIYENDFNGQLVVVTRNKTTHNIFNMNFIKLNSNHLVWSVWSMISYGLESNSILLRITYNQKRKQNT